MTDHLAEAEGQLAREAGDRADALRPLIGPTSQLVRQERAAGIIDALDDPACALDTALLVLGALWPAGPPHDWWQTPLGRLVARATPDTSEAVAHTAAAAMR